MNAEEQTSKCRPKKVLLVDDHPIVRQGIKMLIDHEKDLEVCGEAQSAPQALQIARQTQPDIALVDLSLKDSSGLELIKDLRIHLPDLLILVLSMRDESFYAERVLRAGARGYITKEQASERVIEGIRKVLAGQVYLSDKISSHILSRLVGGKPSVGSTIQKLTDRELAIFEMIGRGMPTRDIANSLHLSVKTVESHREHIKEKLTLENASDLLKHAILWVQCQGSA